MDAALNPAQKRMLEESVHAIGLPVRTANHLEEIEVYTVGDLLSKTSEELLAIPNFGDKTLHEVYTQLHKQGFTKAGFVPPAPTPVPGTDLQPKPTLKIPPAYDPSPKQFRSL